MNTCGIYGLYNTVSGKWYIGQSVSMCRRYKAHISRLHFGIHDNVHLQSAVGKYGLSAFVLYVLEVLPEELLDSRERYWISYFKSTGREFGYNLEDGGHEQKHLSSETKLKLSAAHVGKVLSSEHRQKISLSQKGKIISEETRRKIAAAKLGKPNYKVAGIPRSPEVRAKISAANKGRVVSESARRKTGDALRGRKLSPEVCAAHSRGALGRVVSEETRLKIARANTGKRHSQASREKMSASHIGVPLSEECRKNMSKAQILRNKRARESAPEVLGNYNAV